MKPYILLLFIFITAAPMQATSQTLLKPKDFKVYLDSLGNSDTTIIISKSTLLKAKGFKANFSWVIIKKITLTALSIDPFRKCCVEPIIEIWEGDKLPTKAFETFKKLTKEEAIFFEFEAEDKDGKHISLPFIRVHIADN